MKTTAVLLARNDNALARDVLGTLRRLRPAGQFDLQTFASAIEQPFDDCWPNLESADGGSSQRFFLSDDPMTRRPDNPIIYFPSAADHQGMTPDLREAESVFGQCAGFSMTGFVLLSSALIYGTGPGRQSLVPETYSIRGTGRGIANCSHPKMRGAYWGPRCWKSLEDLAVHYLQDRMRLTILRPVTVVPSATLPARRFAGRFSVAVAGYDPVIQLLSLPDLAQAVLCVLEQRGEGVFNVAPDAVVPLHTAIGIAGKRRISLPLTWQRIGTSRETLDYLRYPWTVSNKKIKQQLGFSAAAPREINQSNAPAPGSPARGGFSRVGVEAPEFDEFGLDKDYIGSYNKRLFKFLCNRYWRIETQGLEHIPKQGPAVLVGMHRGFIPLDGIMAVHLIMRETGRVPRFLTHPALLKFPYIANFVAKMGGVVACEESADRVLESGGLLGVFPEGVRGAFSLCREAYKLLDFGRDSFVKLARRHRAPIIPFVTAGSAEVFPILARIKSRRWTRWTDWPWLPVSTFPLLPFPLPSKWHMQFLPPIRVEDYQPKPGCESTTLKAISAEVRTRMQKAVDEIIQRRRSIFFG